MLSRLLYNVFFYCITPLILLRVAWRSIKEPDYAANLPQRFGFTKGKQKTRGQEKPIWVHAVSAGETIAAIPLVELLLNQGHDILLTAMTPTGRERAASLLADKVKEGRVQLAYAPYDLSGSIVRFLKNTTPKALVIIDTELWPNMLHYCAAACVPAYLVNARLSEKSARGYEKISALSKPMIKKLRRVYAQSEKQGQRFLELGLPNSHLSNVGSIKFDARLPKDFSKRQAKLETKFGDRFCILAASTHAGEEEQILEACSMLSKEHLLILAPRHSHRASSVFDLCKSKGLNIERHSEVRDGEIEGRTSVYLLDTMGELLYFYGIAKVAFIGGSLIDIGGHNPMEAANLGVPMIMGSYRRNINDIAEQFIEAGAMLSITDQSSLNKSLSDLTNSEALREDMSEAAKKVMEQNKGALEIIASEINKELT